MAHHAAPIGIFDSGLGGLSVLDAIHRRLPDEPLIYVADSYYAPYGEKSDVFVRARSRALSKWLIAQHAKMVVVACNTATTHAIASLRNEFTLPFVGVEPGVKPAVLASASGVVGVLATAATLRSARFQTLLDAQAHEVRFVCQAGHGLVELIEQGGVDGPEMDTLLRRYLTPMVDQGADTVVLGCTHYALLSAGIRRLFGDDLTLVETGRAVARRVDHQLGELGLRTAAHAKASIRYVSTAPAKAGRAALQHLAEQISPGSDRIEAVSIDTPMGEPA